MDMEKKKIKTITLCF